MADSMIRNKLFVPQMELRVGAVDGEFAEDGLAIDFECPALLLT